MKRSHVFLTPATKDKAGEVVELEYDSEPVQYLSPVSPYAANDAELTKLRAAVSQAETDLRHAQSRGLTPTELMRYESALESARSELDAAEDPHRRQRARETGIGRDDVPPPSARQSEDPRQFMEPVPYFTRQSAVSDELKELRKKVAEAVKALGEARAAGASATQIMRMEESVRSLKEELAQAEFGKAGGGSTDQAPRTDPPRAERIGKAPTAGKNAASWDKHLRDLDAKLLANVLRPTATVQNTITTRCANSPRCTPGAGRYQCPRCRAAAAA
jgi:hypothetical protein